MRAKPTGRHPRSITPHIEGVGAVVADLHEHQVDEEPHKMPGSVACAHIGSEDTVCIVAPEDSVGKYYIFVLLQCHRIPKSNHLGRTKLTSMIDSDCGLCTNVTLSVCMFMNYKHVDNSRDTQLF
jgi:hypothetical protein